MTATHGQMPGAAGAVNMHVPYAWTYADATARAAAVGFDSGDVGKLARQLNDNSLWMLTGTSPVAWIAAGGGGSGFPAGTRMLFQQTSAPTGWTKVTAINDATLRVVSGTVGTGGTVNFSTLFARTATNAHTLTTEQIPAHTHSLTLKRAQGLSDDGLASGYALYTQSFTSSSVGSGGSHSHGLDMRVKYVDVIIATKA